MDTTWTKQNGEPSRSLRIPNSESGDTIEVHFTSSQPMVPLSLLARLPDLKGPDPQLSQESGSDSPATKKRKLTARKSTGGMPPSASQGSAKPKPTSQSSTQPTPHRKTGPKSKSARFVYEYDDDTKSPSQPPPIQITPIKLMNLKDLMSVSGSAGTLGALSPHTAKPFSQGSASAPAPNVKGKLKANSPISSPQTSSVSLSSSAVIKQTARKTLKKKGTKSTTSGTASQRNSLKGTNSSTSGAGTWLSPKKQSLADYLATSTTSGAPNIVLSEQEKNELIYHAQRFFRRSMIIKPPFPGAKTSKPDPNASHVPIDPPPVSRTKFEAVIAKNSADEEFAPKIYIENDVDNEPCPKLDFYWTNGMLYGVDVPKPAPSITSGAKLNRPSSSFSSSRSSSAGVVEGSNKKRRKGKAKEEHEPSLQVIEGCDCPGDQCDADYCACATKQAIEVASSHLDDDLPDGFMFYSEPGPTQGTLKKLGIRIVECNSKCGCSPACPNRLIQNGRNVKVSIRKTRDRGWGLFAKQAMPTGAFIGVYAGEVITNEEASRRGALYESLGTSYLFDLDEDDFDEEGSSTGAVKYAVDARYVGNHTRYLNHSCDPNCGFVTVAIPGQHRDIYQLALFTLEEVMDGQELTFDYAPNLGPGPLHKHRLPDFETGGARHVRCRCGAEDCRGVIWM